MPTPAINDSVVTGARRFLETLNASGGTPIERLPPQAARQVLTDAQNSVRVDLSGVKRSEKTIDADGQSLKLHVLKPAGAAATGLPAFMFFHGGG
ncbi:MAG TPA: hypothetical protein VFY87_30295 [Geminicoccaceae bacterium]|nr:hypothetical protein [Geminicoccaceae bacterium]